jgi:hypothetical protein
MTLEHMLESNADLVDTSFAVYKNKILREVAEEAIRLRDKAAMADAGASRPAQEHEDEKPRDVASFEPMPTTWDEEMVYKDLLEIIEVEEGEAKNTTGRVLLSKQGAANSGRAQTLTSKILQDESLLDLVSSMSTPNLLGIRDRFFIEFVSEKGERDGVNALNLGLEKLKEEDVALFRFISLYSNPGALSDLMVFLNNVPSLMVADEAHIQKLCKSFCQQIHATHLKLACFPGTKHLKPTGVATYGSARNVMFASEQAQKGLLKVKYTHNNQEVECALSVTLPGGTQRRLEGTFQSVHIGPSDEFGDFDDLSAPKAKGPPSSLLKQEEAPPVPSSKKQPDGKFLQ